MANFWYAVARTAALSGNLDLVTHDIKIYLCDVSYVANKDTDDNVSDIPGGSIVATSGNLTSKTVTDGVFDAADVLFAALTGDEVTQIVVWDDTDNIPVIHIDSFPAYTPDGNDVTIVWSNGSAKIGKI